MGRWNHSIAKMHPGAGLKARAAILSVLAVALAGTLALPATASAGCAGAGANPHEVSLGKIRSATLCLLNQKREQRGVKSLRHNSDLLQAASRHSRQMVKKGFFSHTSLNGDSPTDRIRKTGYLQGSRSWATGENIGWGAYDRATPKAMVRAWMNSPGHRRSILSRKFRHIGIGIARGAPVSGMAQAATYTTDFGRR